MSLTEKADQAMKGVAEQAGNTLPEVQGMVDSAAKAAAPAVEATSNPDVWKKIGMVLLHVADPINDAISRYYTGGFPAYRVTKEAIGAAKAISETSETGEKKSEE